MTEKQICRSGCCTLFQTRPNKLVRAIGEVADRTAGSEDARVKKAGVLVICDGMVLLSQSHQSCWGLPKGGMEVCDLGSRKRCAERELLEETGLPWSLRDEDLLISINDVYVYYVNVPKSFMVADFPAACFLFPSINSHENLKDVLRRLDCTGVGWAKIGCLDSFKVNALTKAACKYFVSSREK